jgi:hypothetical protein
VVGDLDGANRLTFTVSLGLLLGVKVDSRAQLSLWAWVILLPLIMPIVFSLLQGLIPDVWVRIFSLVPSAVILQLSRTSFANPIPIGKTLLQLAWVAAAAGAGLAGTAWILRRLDRETGALPSPWRPSLTTRIGKESLSLFAPLLEWAARLHRLQETAGYGTPETMGRTHRKPRRHSSLSIIGVIAAKDLVEALKNRLILSILLGSTFLLLGRGAASASFF